MEKPAHLPEDAIFAESYNEWHLGNENSNGQRVGTWKTWDLQGLLSMGRDSS
jgi:hypothetical protein